MNGICVLAIETPERSPEPSTKRSTGKKARLRGLHQSQVRWHRDAGPGLQACEEDVPAP